MVATKTEMSTGTRIGITRTGTRTRTGTKTGTAIAIRTKTRIVIATGAEIAIATRTKTAIDTPIAIATTIDIVSTTPRSPTTRKTITAMLIARTLTSGAMKTACIPAPTMRVAERATIPSVRTFSEAGRTGTARYLGGAT